MPNSRLLIALRCGSFDDFPTKLSSEDAQSLLCCWTSCWHPALIARTQSRPDIWDISADLVGAPEDESSETGTADAPSKTLSDRSLIVAPSFLELPSSLNEQVLRTDSVLLPHQVATPRNDFVASLLASSEAPDGSAPAGAESADLASDFFALGYGWLQLRLMTLKVRYSTNLDDEHLDAKLIEAAVAWQSGKIAETVEGLTACFDLLLEEKNRYYSVEPDLIDLVLLETTTLGEKLTRQLDVESHLNFLLTGQVAAQVTQQQPRLRERIEQETATVIGGLERELPESLLPLETRLRQLQVGIDTIEQRFGERPRVFARRRSGLNSMTPGLLEQLNFQGAGHWTLDGGKLPKCSAANIRWVGDDAQTIPALTSAPLDAADARSFLALGVRLARQIDSEHTATVVLAHWPSRVSDHLVDLQRIAKYGPLLGQFTSLNEYFEAVYDPGYGDTFSSDQYESPERKRCVDTNVVDPVSRYVTYWHLQAQLQACRHLNTMLAGRALVEAKSDSVETLNVLRAASADLGRLDAELDRFAATECFEDSPAAQLQTELDALQARLLSHFAGHGDADSLTAKQSVLLNLHSFPASAYTAGEAIFEVPAMGFIQADDQRVKQAAEQLGGPPVDDGLTLRNEFFQLHIDPKSGGIRGIQNYNDRYTQASQRLSIWLGGNRYADMVASDVSVQRNGSLESEIISVGKLVDPESKEPLCEFTQTVRVRRRDRVAEVAVRLKPIGDFGTARSQHYVCSRLAWHDEMAPLFFGTAEHRYQAAEDDLDAPAYVRIEQPNHSLTLLTGGLPWHRRSSGNRLDTILLTGNETQREFRFGLGSDCPYDLVTSIARSSPPLTLPSQAIGVPGDGWLFHFSSKNLVTTWSEPLLENGRLAGVQFRLLETQGRRGKLKLTCPFEVADAARVMFAGPPAETLRFDGRVVTVEFSRNEFFQIQIFASIS